MEEWIPSSKSGKPIRRPYRLLTSERLYRGRFYELVRDQFVYYKAPSKVVVRDTIEHPGAVVILPFTSRKTVLLVKQFRWAAKGDLWEIPAGTLEKGERPLTCAKRELAEETGFRAKRWRLLTRFYPAPGMSNEIMWLYQAEDLSPGERNLDHDEWMDVHEVPVRRALQMIRSGAIRDGKSIAGLLWATQKAFQRV